jgi:hypothetical protein
VLLGRFAGKPTVDLCGDTDHELARVGMFRQRLGDRFAGFSQIGEYVTDDIFETRVGFDRGGREPGQ